MATEISEKVVEARETETAINESRNRYRPVAERGAMLFFLLNSLNKIHAFYQYSLNAFVTVFSRGLDLAPGGPKKKENMTLRQLQKRLSGAAGDYEEVIKKARGQSSNAGGKLSKRVTAQSGYTTPGGCQNWPLYRAWETGCFIASIPRAYSPSTCAGACALTAGFAVAALQAVRCHPPA